MLYVVVFHASPKLIIGGFIVVNVFLGVFSFLIAKIPFEYLNACELSFLEVYEGLMRRVFPALLLLIIER